MRINIDIRDDIPAEIALECVKMVVKQGRVSEGEHGKKYYCWATEFDTPAGDVWVATRPYRKHDCFIVYKMSNNKL